MDKYTVLVIDNKTRETVFEKEGNAILAVAVSDSEAQSFFMPGEEFETELLISAAEEIFSGDE